MATTFNPPVKLAPYLFRLTWSGTAPFRVYDHYQHKYIETDTTLTQLDITSPFATQCQGIEIKDSTETLMDGDLYPGLARVQWRGQTDMKKYQIDNGQTILNWTPEDGRGYYDYTFPRSQLGVIDDQVINLTSFDSELNQVATQLPEISLVTVPIMYEFDLTYNAGTTTITVGLV